jgi:hypothetical protein
LKNYYEMLSVAPDAPTDEIKKAFRREIARYHPDKVQHLGQEFQEMAAGIAADLTEAYRILMDPALRSKYDEDVSAGGVEAPMRPPPPRPPAEPPTPPPPPPSGGPSAPHAPPPSRPQAGVDFVKRAALSKIRAAVADVLGPSDAVVAPGFDLAVATKGKKGLFKKAEDPICLLVKYVPFVDAQSVIDAWTPGSRVKSPNGGGCVLMLVGAGFSPAKELSAAVTEQRRKLRGTGPVLVPVDVRDWEALFPPETPVIIRSLIQHLKEQKA